MKIFESFFKINHSQALLKIKLSDGSVEMIKSYYSSPKDIDYQDDDCRKDILINIEQLEKENINLVFNRADYNHYESLTKWRPKLP